MAVLDRAISLASDSTVRKRLHARFALDQSAITDLTQDIAQLRVAAYEGRLNQLADAMGIDAEPSLYDSAVLGRLHADARGSAASIVHTHNEDLRAFIAAQPKGLPQSELARRVREWEARRQDWKADQIAAQEGYSALNQADADVIKRNKLQLERRVYPQTAQEDLCVSLIKRGWLKPQQVDFELPRHVGCVHRFEYRQPLDAAIAGKNQVWLGDWIPMSTSLSDELGELPEGGSDSTVTDQFGPFNPEVTVHMRDLGHGAIHSLYFTSDDSHIGSVVSRGKGAHTAVQWNGNVSEHATLEGAMRHMATAHGVMMGDMP